VALAVFVKTPGLSPIKTRLAEGLGRDRALAFYRLSVAAVEATAVAVTASNDVAAHWAVAEEAGLADSQWHRFPRIDQGTGGLGERLGHVFGQLRRRSDAVIAIGGDSPQITPELIRWACGPLRQDRGQAAHVLGRCHDGGFYLVGTNRPLPPETWRDVPYSTPDAAARLAENLAPQGPIVELPRLCDVDRADDLTLLADELREISDPSAAQRAVLNWIVAAETMSNDE
jgi:hypothetical protein